MYIEQVLFLGRRFLKAVSFLGQFAGLYQTQTQNLLKVVTMVINLQINKYTF